MYLRNRASLVPRSPCVGTPPKVTSVFHPRFPHKWVFDLHVPHMLPGKTSMEFMVFCHLLLSTLYYVFVTHPVIDDCGCGLFFFPPS